MRAVPRFTASSVCPSIHSCPTTPVTVGATSRRHSNTRVPSVSSSARSSSSSSTRSRWYVPTSSTSSTRCCASIPATLSPSAASSCSSWAISTSSNPCSRTTIVSFCNPSTPAAISSMRRCGNRCPSSPSNSARSIARATPTSLPSSTASATTPSPRPISTPSTSACCRHLATTTVRHQTASWRSRWPPAATSSITSTNSDSLPCLATPPPSSAPSRATSLRPPYPHPSNCS